MRDNMEFYRKKISMHNCLMLAFVVFIFGCSEPKNINELISKAAEQISKESYSAAIISLKKAVQIDKKNAKARELLANTYLAVGNYPAAEKEYRRALQFGGKNTNIISGLGYSLNNQGKYKQVLTEEHFNSIVDRSSSINVLVLRGNANFGLGRLRDAEAAYRGVLKLNSKSIAALIGMAKVETRNRRYKDAHIYIDKARQLDNENIDLLFAQGNLNYQEANLQEAEKIFLKIITASKKDSITSQQFRAYISLITLYLKQKNIKYADEKTQVLLKKIPNHPLPKYFSALIDYQNKNYEDAQRKLRGVVEKLPNNMQAVFLLGATNYALSNYEQANVLLSKFIANVPTHIPARKLLTIIRLKLNRPKAAIEAISPAVGQDTTDVQLLIMAGMAASSMGDVSAGMRYYKQAGRLNTGSKLIREELAKIYLAEGDTDKAIEELELNIKDTESVRSLVLLARAHLKKGKSKQAREYVQRAITAKENSPELYTLLGVVELFGGNRDLAIVAFRQAINISNNYIPAMFYLARLELENGNLSNAEEHFSNILSSHQNNLSAMFGMAQISEMRGDIPHAIEWLKKAIKTNPKEAKPYLILGYYYLKTKQINEALKLVSDLEKLDSDPAILLYVARTYLSSGQYQKGISTLRKIDIDNKNDSVIYSELARAYLISGDIDLARLEINKAIGLKPNNIKLQIIKAKMEISSGNIDSALKIAKKIELLHPKSALSYELYGDIYRTSKSYNKAVANYQKAIVKNPNPILYVKKANIFSQKKNTNQAVKILKKAEELFPGNKTILFALANLYQSNNKSVAAIKYYENILKEQPDNAVVLNNVAYAYLDVNKEKSLQYAQQAHKISPNSIAVIDTLAWTLVKNGRNEDAVGYLAGIYGSTNIPSIHYHYAVGLYNLGKYNLAKKVLSELANSNKVFKEREEARQLLIKIERR